MPVFHSRSFRLALIAFIAALVSNSASAQSTTSDSLLNGAAIGAAAGATSIVLFCHTMEPWGICFQPEPIIKGAAVGAGMGIVIDALIRKRTTTANWPPGRLNVAPVVTPHHKGVRLALRF